MLICKLTHKIEQLKQCCGRTNRDNAVTKFLKETRLQKYWGNGIYGPQSCKVAGSKIFSLFVHQFLPA